MTKGKNPLIIGGALVGAVLVAGAGAFWFATRPKSVQEEGAPGGVVGLANPASVYCEEQGGTLRNEETEEGTRGVCVLPDGTECGEWDYFYGRCLKNDGSDYSTFQTEDGNFSFDYPANWNRAEVENLATLLPEDFVNKYSLTMPLFISNPQNAQVSLSVYRFEEGTDLGAAMDALKEELVILGSPYNEVNRETVGDSLVVDSTVETQGVTVQVRDILFLAPNDPKNVIYNLSFSARQSAWGEYETIFSHIQDSAKLSL